MTDVEILAKALYACEWQADLYATPLGPETVAYEGNPVLADDLFKWLEDLTGPASTVTTEDT